MQPWPPFVRTSVLLKRTLFRTIEKISIWLTRVQIDRNGDRQQSVHSRSLPPSIGPKLDIIGKSRFAIDPLATSEDLP